ncbi:lipopolysaccharide biosynthesis protein [Pedobacter puniceum]|uniref:Oligosaccharide flippase family protein n=1 Tax=Pedobacter puniceum TaxID=2666136 RepID=A0A7K0FQV9_9SPHI|nr:polysaccharide biosynthesis C-terminal domain-containing protein [Pedobacter puniceum]MRX48369.1 hypothetical protein [Pedobacter puniceum]
MLKKIIFSFQANFVVAVITLVISLITAKFLGSYGRGYLSIIAIYIALVQLINDILGVGVVFFLLKRYQVNEIVFISYVWFLFVTTIGTLILTHIGLIGIQFKYVFFLNVLSASIFALNLRILINKVKIKWYNMLVILQPLIVFILLYLKGFSDFSIKDFLIFQGVSYMIPSAFSILLLMNEFKEQFRVFVIKDLIKESFKLGIINQGANFSQIVNYRVSFFFIEKYEGLKAVGVFSVLFSFANVIWLFAVTVGTLLGNEVSKSDKLNGGSIAQFSNYIKITLIFTFILIIGIYLLPSQVYVDLLNKDFYQIKRLLLLLSPAIIIFSSAKVLGYFFSSQGKMKINFYASLAGLIPSIVLGYILIKEFKIYGAILTCSISFILSSFILGYFFWKESENSQNHLIK